MNRSLDTLDHRFFPIAIEFLARLVESGIPVVIVNTRRTAAEQAVAHATGRSWVTHSKHEDGLAMDVCPFDTFQLHGVDKLAWNAADPVWTEIATVAESLGLRSGYRWAVRDCGHVEFVDSPLAPAV